MKSIGCVIPCYKGGKVTLGIVKETLKIVDYCVVVDDFCPYSTGEMLLNEISNNGLIIIKNEQNKGVGYSVKKGMKYLLDIDCEIIIKIDADGQINPNLIPEIVEILSQGSTEAVKGNRFTSVDSVLKMPTIRIFGNLALSFLNKISSGYWELFDPTNGFIAFKSSSLRKVRLDKTNNGYFFESDLLFQCSLSDIYFRQISMNSIYRNEISSLNPLLEIFRFGRLHFINLIKRIIYQYFILDFNAGSLELFGFFATSLISLLYSSYIFYLGFSFNELASPGQASLLVILIIISFQLLIAFIYFDSTQKPLLRKIESIHKNY